MYQVLMIAWFVSIIIVCCLYVVGLYRWLKFAVALYRSLKG